MSEFYLFYDNAGRYFYGLLGASHLVPQNIVLVSLLEEEGSECWTVGCATGEGWDREDWERKWRGRELRCVATREAREARPL